MEDVREEDVDLVGRADAPHRSRDVLILPEGLTLPVKKIKARRTYDWDWEGFVDELMKEPPHPYQEAFQVRK